MPLRLHRGYQREYVTGVYPGTLGDYVSREHVTYTFYTLQTALPQYTVSYYYGGTMLNKTYGTHKNLYFSLFLLAIFGPIHCGTPQ